ncbi:MAG: hypothetical protein DWQ20_07075 [Actinobacteria bacterium]|nr:MAG: hypothetical protein DWQ20_07075 [Actinomycetota bacterium]
MLEGRSWRWGILMFAVALTAAACGSSSAETTTTISETSTTGDTRPPRTSTTTPGNATTTTVEPGTTTTVASTTGNTEPAPPVGTGTVGVVGCSNTDLAVAGYTDLSSLDRLTTGDLGGGSPPSWGDPSEDRYPEYWGIYEDRRPATGYVETWVQLCLRSSEHQGSFDETEQAWITHIVDQIHQRDPGIPIWISPVNFYEGIVCDAVGADGPAIAAEASDWAASALPGVFRGPDLGPLTSAEVGVRDDCHPNQAGQRLLGGQLVDFFD